MRRGREMPTLGRITAVTGETPDAAALFRAFLGVGLSGFGGVLPFARRELVERRRWLTAEGFNETLSLCQSLPGPNIVNVSAVVGARFAGARGAVAAVTGLMAAPVAIVIALGLAYGRFAAEGRLPQVMAGLGAAASGLVVATAAKMAWPLLTRRPVSAGAAMLAAFVGVGLLAAPLPWVLLAVTPVSVAVAWRLGTSRLRA